MDKNIKAFLDMLAWSELGSLMLAESRDGYDVLVGSLPGRLKRFYDYSDHPRMLIKVNDKISSTAAGRYQILKKTFDSYKKTLKLKDFSPQSQDAIAIQLIKERGAYQDIVEGNIVSAISKVSNIWASLPGAGYGQHEHRKADLLLAFKAAGGKLKEV